MNLLEQLKNVTVVVADSGDVDSIKALNPTDATTNPSLILQAAKLPQYQHLIADAIEKAAENIDDICDIASDDWGKDEHPSIIVESLDEAVKSMATGLGWKPTQKTI